MGFTFGLLTSINGNVSTAAFVVTILFLVTCDALTNMLEASLKGSVIYNSMLQKIYKEIMIMGLVSFGITMYQASDTAHEASMKDWLEAADFVGYIMFFVAIFFVIRAFYIMILSMQMKRRYASLDKASISDVLEEFNQAKTSPLNLFLMRFRLIPTLQVMKNVEFKIGWSVFRDTYELPSRFDYVEYISRCLKRFALRLVNIHTSSWLFVFVLVLLNYGRMWAFDKKCRSGFSLDERENHEEAYDECEEMHRTMFQLSGFFIVVYTISLYVLGRIYSFRIIARAGVLDVSDYENFLIFEESTLVSNEQRKMKARRQKRKSSLVEFKGAMHDFLLQQAKLEKEKKEEMRDKSLWNLVRRKLSSKKRGSRSKVIARVGTCSFEEARREPDIRKDDAGNDDSDEGVPRAIYAVEGEDATDTKSRSNENSMLTDAATGLPKLKVQRNKFPSMVVKENDLNVKFSDDLSEIFLFNSPNLYFKSVEIGILMNSLFAAVWFCNYMTNSSFGFETSLLFIIPLLVCLPVIGEVVKIASLIDCTATLHMDVVASIIEDLEAGENLKKEVVRKMKRLSRAEDDVVAKVNKMFTELASESSPDEISPEDFRQILGSLKIHFSDRKFMTAMRHADLNANGRINLHEIGAFLFPEREEAFQVMRRETINQGHQAAARERSSRRTMNKKMLHVLGMDISSSTSSPRSLSSNNNSIRCGFSDDDSSVGTISRERSSRTSARMTSSIAPKRCDSIESELSAPLYDIDSEGFVLGGNVR